MNYNESLLENFKRKLGRGYDHPDYIFVCEVFRAQLEIFFYKGHFAR